MLNVFIFSAIFGLIQALVVGAGVVKPSISSLENVNFLYNNFDDNSETAEGFNSLFGHTEYLKEDKDCPTMDMLIGQGGEFLVNTTKILTGTIHAFYVIMANDTACKNFNGFRCFLRKYHEFGVTLVDVGEKVSLYKKNALSVIRMFNDYFGRCKVKDAKSHSQL